ncbi:MAG: beta-N-acetylhexosaminidase [Acidobacteriota bacterium]
MPRMLLLLLLMPILTHPAAARGVATDLRLLGYSLIPSPQQTQLSGREIYLDASWQVASELVPNHVARRRLEEGLRTLHGLELSGQGKNRILLRIQKDAVPSGPRDEARPQAYALRLAPQRIEVVGNGDPGVFYGVQSLLQLLRSRGGRGWSLPEGTITDWPSLELRFLHWDTKHHQDRLETLRRFIDWAAFFKANAIGFEIEDKYEYPRHPVIGAPGAFTKSEIQQLTAYALERYIQLVPQIQSPAHMAYVLKHEEFRHLQADRSNYQACLCSEEALRLMQDMYQDMIEATPGVEYFHVSTDEVYFAGICPQCQVKRPYNNENRSLAWLEFVQRMHAWLAERNRKMLCWVEYPLLTEHIQQLPKGLINGVITLGNDDRWVEGFKERSIPSLIYSSQQGSELLFPNYFSSDVLYRERPIRGSLDQAAITIRNLSNGPAVTIGTYAAAWDDSGLHNELFWLGWATVTQYGWSADSPSPEQSVADFMDVFYGPGNQDLIEIYRTLMEGARFYEENLDQVPATRLKPTYGSWAGKGRDTTRIDLTLEPPPLPFSYDETLVSGTRFTQRYARALEQAGDVRRRLELAIGTLQGKLGPQTRNPYNVEVLLSIAGFEKHFVDMLLDLAQVERSLRNASHALSEEKQSETLGALVRAHQIVRGILAERAAMWENLKTVWEKSRFEKGRSVAGRQFVHVLDDLKDHHADRRPGLDYMLEPLENIGLEKWNSELAAFIRTFAQSRGLGVPKM